MDEKELHERITIMTGALRKEYVKQIKKVPNNYQLKDFVDLLLSVLVSFNCYTLKTLEASTDNNLDMPKMLKTITRALNSALLTANEENEKLH
jgi:hypothetical protein